MFSNTVVQKFSTYKIGLAAELGYNGECTECRPQTAGGNWAKHNLTDEQMTQRGTDKRFCGECKIPTVEAEVDADADAEADA